MQAHPTEGVLLGFVTKMQEKRKKDHMVPVSAICLFPDYAMDHHKATCRMQYN